MLQTSPALYTATGCTVVAASVGSMSQIACITGSGIGANLVWSLEIGSQNASTPSGAVTSSYGRPVISSFSGDGSLNAVTLGNQVCMILCT